MNAKKNYHKSKNKNLDLMNKFNPIIIVALVIQKNF